MGGAARDRSDPAGADGGAGGHLTVGRVRRAHGIRGEVAVELLTDHPDLVFEPGRALLLDAGAGADLSELVVDAARPHKGSMLVRFRGVDSRSAAETLAGRELLVPAEDVAPLETGEVFVHDLPGLEVRLVDGTLVGTVQRVYEAEPAELLEVRAAEGGRKLLIPLSRQIVRELDVEAGRLVIDPPPGLLDL